MRLELVESCNGSIGVVQQFLPGRTESGILIYFSGCNQLVDFGFEVVELRDGVAEFALVYLESGFVEFSD